MTKLLTRNIFILFIIGMTALLSSCGSRNEASENEVVIEGRFIHSRANVVFIDIIHVETLERVDSLVLDEDGSFTFRKKTDEPLFLKVYTDEENFITIIAEPGQTITLNGDINALALTYSVSGSPASEIISQYQVFTKGQTDKLDTLSLIWENNKYAENKMALRDSLDSLAKIIYTEQRDFALDVIRKNPASLGSLFIIYQQFGGRPILDPVSYIEDYQKLAQSLAKVYPSFEHVGHLNTRVNKTKLGIKEEEEIKARLDTGKIAPDFNVPDLNENTISLSNFKGQPVLLHFWASWSPESMMQINTLRYYKQTYGPKGLVIISISFDYDRTMWTNAIEKEKMEWTHICDLKYTDSPLARLYHIDQVPFFYLLDRNGAIVNKSNNPDVTGNAIYRLFFPR